MAVVFDHALSGMVVYAVVAVAGASWFSTTLPSVAGSCLAASAAEKRRAPQRSAMVRRTVGEVVVVFMVNIVDGG